jgi:acyl dehydratase
VRETDDPAAPATRLRFERPPGAIPVFVKALFDDRPARLDEGVTAGRIEGRIEAFRVSDAQLDRYRKICGFPDSELLPLSFPHVLAAGLHARMLLQPEFPVRLPGLIHVWHEIRQHRRLRVDEQLEMACSIEGHRDVAAGAEFCLRTLVIAGGTTVWQEDTGFISRSVRRAPKGTSPTPEPPARVSQAVAEWQADSGIGRRYARASGDYNPIHLFDAAARRFGFPAAIAHGMWTLARAAAVLERATGQAGASIRVRFRRPVLIPASLRLLSGNESATGVPFEVRVSATDSVVLDGHWSA